ncbi:Na/Pi cotransporter family protein [Polaribacter sp. Q13]|uniref:Na/Pi cotransporter family protein n=1 Tax=Polaribacter sp. Q13 TaxID=2806551 RepID=UPI00193C0F2A|nr:Na/Pi symporter [Polaribacter sp. Q13]QVY64298.1 Na/Pi cotransporter family protein [Polaribacter sp. Q13]
MIKKLLFAAFLVIVAIVLYFNPNFKTIAAGVAILLFGMGMLEEGFKVFTKGPLQNILKKTTDKLYKSITAGAVVTALLQSSSLVSVITISFISAGLISLSGGLGLIFGANIGSTTTAWLVAGFGLKINISTLAMPMIIFGLIFTFQKKETFKGIGNVFAGLGFFFLGIYFMKEGFDVFSTQINLTEYAVSGFKGVLLYTAIGVVITVVLQSSAASLVLVLTALAAGQIEYENALALAIGANVGTTITAVLGSLNSNIAGKRLAGAHLIFNVVTGAVAVAFIYPLSKLVNNIADWVHIAATDYTLKLALFHTIFNLIGVIIMVPFIKKLENYLLKIFKENKNKEVDEPKYLNEAILKFPGTLVSSLLNESKYLYKNAIFEIVAHALNVHRDAIKSDERIKKIVEDSKEKMNVDVNLLYYNKVKNIYGQIISFAARGQQDLKLTKEQNNRLSELKLANRKMVEIIRDARYLEKNVVAYLESDNEYIKKEYNKFRKKVVKVLRVIYLFRKKEEKDEYYDQLIKLKKAAKSALQADNKSINKLIRKNLITTDMASSIVNDNVNVNDLIMKLIEVAELLYSEKDSILENDK